MRFVLTLAVIVGITHSAHAKNCDLSVSPYPFGNYDVFAGSDTNVAPVTLMFSCTGDETVSIAITRGTASTSFAPRSMTQGSQPKLDYYFYTSAARTTIWGDGTGGSGVYTQDATKKTNYSIPIYGRIVAGQDVNVGTYSEPSVLTITISDASSGRVEDTQTLAVSATVVQACKIATSPLAFGNYDPVSAQKASGSDLTVDAANAVSVSCTRGSTASTISLGSGLQPVGGFSRFMASGTNRLAYQIYTSASRTTIWGDGTNSTATRAVASPTSYLTSQGFAAYGTVPKAQDVVAGTYVDTIAATVNF